MKVLIIDVDSVIPNLALKKIERYHLDRGDKVVWNYEFEKYKADKIYVSCVFDWNKNKCREWEGFAEIGGSGYDLKKALPPEIEDIKPRINFGFTMRGCLRKCPFCIVYRKEGLPRVVGDLLDLWDGKSEEVTIMDNNILCLPDHFETIAKQAIERKLIVDFNQGLDIRLLDKDTVKLLDKLRHKSDIRFAWDNMSDEAEVVRGIKLMRKYTKKRCMFYVLVGFNTTIKEDLYRLNKIKKMKQRAYVMRYRTTKGSGIYADIASWANMQRYFMKMSFKRFQKVRHFKGVRPGDGLVCRDLLLGERDGVY
jgi:radical SAM superfamily enzyme YgiQ (UPF0313 family)